MSIRHSALFAAATLLSAGVAAAADIPSAGPAAAPAPAFRGSIPAFSWTGYYAGLHAGFGRTYEDKVGLHHRDAGGLRVYDAGGNLTPGGMLAGIQFGHNWQAGNVVFGWEADASLLSGSSRFTGTYGAIGNTVTSQASKRGVGSLRSRFGYAFGQTLVYGTGGIGATEVTYRMTPTAGTPFSASNMRIGAVVGAGVEHAFGNGWSARAEGLFNVIGVRRLPETVVPTGRISSLETQSHWQMRFGVNYLFGGQDAAPVIARY